MHVLCSYVVVVVVVIIIIILNEWMFTRWINVTIK